MISVFSYLKMIINPHHKISKESNNMSRCLFFCAVIFFTTSVFIQSASAQSDSKDEAIEELLQAMNTLVNMETSLSSMKDTIKMNSPYFLKEIKVILARELSDKDVSLATEAYNADEFGADRLYELFRYKFNLDRVNKEIMLPAYRKNYTEAEIRELTKFYQSELGQKTLQLSTQITREISSKTRDMSQMAINQAKEELAYELKQGLKKTE